LHMIIMCPDCSTRYRVDAKTLGQSGREVRCASCGHSWFATEEMDERNTKKRAIEEAASDIEPNIEPTIEDDVLDIPSEQDAELEITPPEVEDKPAPAHQKYRQKIEAKAKRKRLFVVLGAWAGVFVALLVIASVLVLNRVAVVKLLPKTAGTFAAIGMPVQVWGVELKDVTSARIRVNRDDVLRITGALYNPGEKPERAPLVRISMRDETGAEILAWTVTVDPPEVPAGKSAHFETSVKNPAPLAVDLEFDLTDKPIELAPEKPQTEKAHGDSH
jgi:predicted Zn finger-like uncharacterized protein